MSQSKLSLFETVIFMEDKLIMGKIATVFVIDAIAVVVSIVLYFLYGREKEIISGVQLEVPRMLNPLEMALFLKYMILPPDVISLVPYLESEGYLLTKQINAEAMGSSRRYGAYDLEITKLKDYDGNNAMEKYMMGKLFEDRDTVILSEFIKSGDNGIVCAIAQKVYPRKMLDLYTKEPQTVIARKVACGVTWIALLLVNAITASQMVRTDSRVMVTLMAVLFSCVSVLLMSLGNNSHVSWGSGKIIAGKKAIPAKIGMGLIFMCVPCILMAIYTNYALDTIAAYAVSMIILGIIMNVSNAVDRMSDYSREVYSEINRFKDFLNVTERPVLDKMFRDNPAYYMKVLSYGYVLNISDKWVNEYNDYLCNPNMSSDSDGNPYGNDNNSADAVYKLTQLREGFANEVDYYNRLLEPGMIVFGHTAKRIK